MEKYKEIIEVKAEDKDKGKRLDAFLSEFFQDATRSYIQKLIDNKNIMIDGKSKTKSGNKLKGNENITVKIPEDEILEVLPENLPIEIVYEDKDLVVINKDPGVIVHPAQGYYTGTLVNAVLYHIKDLSTINGVIRPGIVHRLDKDTSGLIIIAKNDISHVRLTEMFKDKTIEKRYVCICKGNFKNISGRIETLIGRDVKDRKKMAVVSENGKIAITNYEVIDSVAGFSLVDVGIETGRTHQIRVHMKSLNHPILGDETYGSSSELAKRQMLHSYYLKFNHPITQEEIIILGELKEDFKNVAKKLKLDVSKISRLYK
ncbi:MULTISPECIES: RluA family pseudouridine synthase [Cetobacterium]|jgi:23S rRNA pseudouridine1911/1915/1917 synthase|uniref:Pseudouridine synthase n=1 Tax=Candidatus Cetobacterium colombiensis TaxID=3073100 RepID=A0ABU4WDU9_9FUSO|nr:RluA family pseudouridine synthase [Candidatus Cetobacterium colombiensis]MDX8336683.1 RluA family pseudouridine synthase [Candidatus Cetobacterium colombiensis]